MALLMASCFEKIQVPKAGALNEAPSYSNRIQVHKNQIEDVM